MNEKQKNIMKPGDIVKWNKTIKVGNRINNLNVLNGMPFDGIRTIMLVETNGNVVLEESYFYYNPKMLVLVK